MAGPNNNKETFLGRIAIGSCHSTILQVLIFLSNADGLVPVITAHLGETTTLTCKLPDTKARRNKLFWYRQTAGHSLEVVVKLISLANPEYGAGYSDSRVKAVLTDNVSNLTILKAAQEDEGMYHCGFSDWSQNVWRGTYLLIKDEPFNVKYYFSFIKIIRTLKNMSFLLTCSCFVFYFNVVSESSLWSQNARKVIILLSAALAVSLVVIALLIYFSLKNKCVHCTGKKAVLKQLL
uniref:Ig-like domain-containing protein n=1 Tax=Xiphophorus maculatus TaxID=8083 RepID=A0A3B5QAD8_XIPMA